MEQSTPAVSMPGMPAGATVIETGINGPGAQSAPVAPAFVSPTDGMSASQAAAMAFVDSNRAAAAGDVGNAGPGSLNSRINAALAHALQGGPEPEFLKSEAAKAVAAEQGARVVNEGDMPELAKALEQMSDADAAGALKHGTIVARVSQEIASEVVSFAREAQLPTGTAKAIFDRLGAHADQDGGLGEVSAEDATELAERCAQLLGGYEKAEREINLARAYIKSVGGDVLLAKVDKRAGTLGFDPALILQLSFLARSKGLDNAASHA